MAAADPDGPPVTDGDLTLDREPGRALEPAPETPRKLGGFRILRKLGEGGMGIVYEAEQQSPHRLVALKVVRGGHFVDEAYLRMFRRETETLARLTHPNIAAIYEAGRTDDGQHFFTMELVAGETLGDYVRRHLGGDQPTPAQLRERLRLFVTICQAVNYAHQRGVIHRDLKPGNIVVARMGTGESQAQIKILDFGLARITNADIAAATVLSEVGAIKGTLPYMSPEQARGDGSDIDLRTDVYSLGVILYELLSGKLPYDTQGVAVLQAIRVICEEPPRTLSADDDLQTIVAKALAKDPEHRYQNAAALAEDVERYLKDQPILAHPPSTMYQLKKLVARHKGGVAAAGAIAALLVALAVTMVVQAERVRKERDHATTEAARASAINSYLQDALGAADPWEKGSRNVTLLDALRQAQAKARFALGNQPLVEASVLQTIGTTFSNLAEFTEAEKVLRSSLDLRVSAAGRKSLEAAESLGALSNLYEQWRRFDESETYAREAFEITRRIRGEESLETAAAIRNLATALRRKGRFAEARPLAEEMLRIARAHPDVTTGVEAGGVEARKVEISAVTLLGWLALDRNDFKETEALAREKLALAKKRYPDKHPEIAEALNDVGNALMMNGDLAAAERTLLEGLEMHRELLGEDHPEVALALENLSNVYYRAGQLGKAVKNLEVVLDMRRKALGDDSEPVGRTLANMGSVYKKAGSFDAAERSYREALERLPEKLGSEHPDVGSVSFALGDLLRNRGRFPEAEPLFRRALDIRVKTLGEGNLATQRAIKALADLYTAWKKPEQAAVFTARLKPAEAKAPSTAGR